jgi:16S rRNA (uracil1498-N3)-methyltransferase
MAKRRFHCPDLAGDRIVLDADQSAHARQSLRLSVGDAVELYDGRGGLADGRISVCGREVAVAVEARRTAPRLRPAIDLAAAIPKGPRADALVDAASQAGADRLIPLITEWSVVDPGPKKLERFARIAAESSKQCGRAWLMGVEKSVKLAELLPRADQGLKLLADLQPVHFEPTAADLARSMTLVDRVLIVIGPEGGFSPREREEAAAAGCTPWRFGPHVMRVETAATVAVGLLRQLAGNANTETEG